MVDISFWNRLSKDFFKIKKIKFLLVLLLIFSFNVASADHCTISQVNIIPGSWDNTDAKTSLTVQTQDSGGVSCHTSETIRLSFETSGSGSFSNEGGTSEPQSYISKNSANRNFYYNGGQGDTITIKAGPGTADSWVESWSVSKSVSVVLDSVETEVDISDDNKSNPTNSSSSGSNSNQLSSHSSSVALSTGSPKPKLAINAGRGRLAIVGADVSFVGYIISIENMSESAVKFDWTFGDGGSDSGRNVSHVYKYPGQYTVVANARSKDLNAVARTEVLVVKPEISIKEVVVGFAGKSSLVVENNSNYEVNLGGFRIKNENSEYVLPVDTIIKPKKEIVLADVILSWSEGSVFLIDSIGGTSAQYPSLAGIPLVNQVGYYNSGGTSRSVNISDSEMKLKLEDILKQAVVIKYKLAEIENNNKQAVPVNNIAHKTEVKKEKVDNEETKDLPQLALVENSIVIEKPNGLAKRVLLLSQKLFNWFK